MLKILGAGLGRTGTTTLKTALDMLSYGPCYHMSEVFGNPEHIAIWDAALDGDPVDWDSLFAGYPAAVDYPAAHFWQQLADYYPDAKIILTARDPDEWYRSASKTIFAMLKTDAEGMPEQIAMQNRMARKMVFGQFLQGGIEDPEHAKKSFVAHNELVRQTLPAERLLDYDVSQGWRPLCEFLGCDIPDEQFPHLNTTTEFVARTVEARDGRLPHSAE